MILVATVGISRNDLMSSSSWTRLRLCFNLKNVKKEIKQKNERKGSTVHLQKEADFMWGIIIGIWMREEGLVLKENRLCIQIS